MKYIHINAYIVLQSNYISTHRYPDSLVLYNQRNQMNHNRNTVATLPDQDPCMA